MAALCCTPPVIIMIVGTGVQKPGPAKPPDSTAAVNLRKIGALSSLGGGTRTDRLTYPRPALSGARLPARRILRRHVFGHRGNCWS